MNLCDYKYVMDIQLDEDCKDISDLYLHSKYRTVIDGEEYNLSESAYARYISYKDTPEQAMVRLADATDIPVIVLEDAYAGKYECFWQEIYKKSLFEDKINTAFYELYECDHSLANCIELYSINGKTLDIGSKVVEKEEKSIYKNNSVYSLIVHDDNACVCNKYELTHNDYKQNILYVGRNISDMYDAIICDIAKKWFNGELVIPQIYNVVAKDLGVSDIVADKKEVGVMKRGVVL